MIYDFLICAAYDLKLIIDKDKVDVIKPSWILDSIEKGEGVPLGKKLVVSHDPHLVLIVDFSFRYFFHATNARIATGEYDMDVDEDDSNEPEAEHAGPSGTAHSDAEEQPMHLPDENEVIPKVKEEEIDPALADWFKVEEEKDSHPPEHGGEEDSVTEEDSDNADVAGEPEGDVDLDDWFKVKAEDAVEGSTAAGMQPKVNLI